MADNKDKSKEQSENATEELEEKRIKGYEKLIERLKEERKDLQDELNRNYQETRRYVRSHPEEGVLIAFVGGITLGYILGKIGKK